MIIKGIMYVQLFEENIHQDRLTCINFESITTFLGVEQDMSY